MNEFRQKLLRRTETIPDREKRRLSGGSVLLLLFAALALAVLLSFGLGRYPVGIKELLGILGSRLGVYRGAPFWSETQAVAVWNVRMPRVLLSVLRGLHFNAYSRTPWPRRIFSARPRGPASAPLWPSISVWGAPR